MLQTAVFAACVDDGREPECFAGIPETWSVVLQDWTVE